MSTPDPSQWIKASASDGGSNCVEMRLHDDAVEVRDTKAHGTGPTLGFTKSEFSAWLHGAKNGEFDHLITD